VLENEPPLGILDAAPHELLELGCDPSRIVGKPLVTLSARDRREVADRTAEVDRRGIGLRPRRSTVASKTDQDQALTVLRDPVPERVKHARANAIAERAERLVESREYGPVVPTRKVWHVLHENRGRPQSLDHGDERRP